MSTNLSASGVVGVRGLQRCDIPQVCELFVRTFRKKATGRPEGLATALTDTFLDAPGVIPGAGSLVHVDAGGLINGFYGIINLTLRLRERTLRLGLLCSYMADSPADNPTIGVKLMRKALQLPLDLIFTDTANSTSLDIGRALRAVTLPLQSMEWAKILRPAGTAAFMVGRRWPVLRDVTPPVGRTLDIVAKGVASLKVNTRNLTGVTDQAIPLADFVDGAPALLDQAALRPGWDRQELTWLITQAGLKTKNGPLHIREVLDRNGRRAGLYLIYLRPGGVAASLQTLAREGKEEIVVASMLRFAHESGVVAVKGAASQCVVLGLMHQEGTFYRTTMAAQAWTADPEIAAALRAGNVVLGGLTGETWTRIYSDVFE